MKTDKLFTDTTKMIEELYELLGNSCVEYPDYYQNCAVKFYEDLKSGELEDNKLGAKYSKILFDMNNEVEEERMNTISFVEDFCPLGTRMCFRYSIMMPKHLEKICDLIVAGYNADEICEAIKCDRKKLNKQIRNIKELYKDFRGTYRDEKTSTI